MKKMKLCEYYGIKVRVTTKKHKIISGIIGDLIYPEDNESGEESVIIDTESSYPVEVSQSEIASIERI